MKTVTEKSINVTIDEFPDPGARSNSRGRLYKNEKPLILVTLKYLCQINTPTLSL